MGEHDGAPVELPSDADLATTAVLGSIGLGETMACSTEADLRRTFGPLLENDAGT